MWHEPIMQHRKPNSLPAIALLCLVAAVLALASCEACGPITTDPGCQCDGDSYPGDATPYDRYGHGDVSPRDMAARHDSTAAADASATDSVAGDGASFDHATAPDASGADHPLVVTDLVGIYDLAGSDPVHGAFTGQAEIRSSTTAGTFDVVHLADWSDASFENFRIAQVWQGVLTSTSAPFTLAATLRSVNYITDYDGLTRDPSDIAPHLLQATLQRGAAGKLDVGFTQETSSTPLHWQETWSWRSAPAIDPIWKNLRTQWAGHDPPPSDVKDTLFQTYQTYHEMPEVAPYVARPEFQAAIHYFIFDPTDFDYYQQHDDRVRVIQSVVDTISLAEASQRRLAYHLSLADKELAVEDVMQAHHINEAGIFCDWYQPPSGPGWFIQSGDALLWTGVYVASQAMRYLATSSTVAYASMLRSLDGLMLASDITGQSGQYGRSVRVHVADGDSHWVQGAPPYAGFDWMTGGNNDMLHGLDTGFTWAWIAIEQAGGDSGRQAHMEQITRDLLAFNALTQDGTVGEMKWNLLLYFMNGDTDAWLRYEELFPLMQPFVIDMGNGVRYDYGSTLDCSGDHLIIQSLLVLYALTHELGHRHEADYRDGLRKALEIMRDTRLGFLQLVAGTLGSFNPRPPEVEDALWVMREFQVPKTNVTYDHRIDPDFCLSPYPSLPWKGDWTTANRFEGLYSYPLFERNMDESFQWKSTPMEFRGWASPVAGGYSDYLFAYWFGRHFGVIDATM